MSNALVVADRLENVVAHLAYGKAKTISDTFTANEVTPNELIAMYRGDWLSRKIVDIPVVDALKKWRNWQAEADMIEAIEEQEKRFGVRSKVVQALKWARLFGGSALFIHTGDANPALPLRSIPRGGLKNIVVLHRRELMPLELETDPRLPGFREPKMYTLATTGAGSVYIHPSRVIPFYGPDRPDFEVNAEGWGDSILQIVYEAVHHSALASGGVAELIHEAKIDVINVKNLSSAMATTAGSDAIVKRFSLANMMKSLNNTLMLDEGETWNRRQTSFAGLPDVIKVYLQIVSGAADIPMTRLVGMSPGGLNSTGEGDLRNYYDALSSYREDEVRPALERIDDLLAADAGGTIPAGAWWEFAPLWEPTEKEKAEIADKKASTTQKYVNMGLFPQETLLDVVANQLIEDGTYPGLEQSLAALRSAIASEIDRQQEAELAAAAAGSGPGYVP